METKEIKLGDSYLHKGTGRLYTITAVSIINQNGEWLDNDPVITYQVAHKVGVDRLDDRDTFSRFHSDFITKFNKAPNATTISSDSH